MSTWLDQRAHVEATVAAFIDGLESDPPSSHTDLLVRRFQAGLAWVGNRVGDGGLDVDPDLHELVEERLLHAGHLDVEDRRAAQRGLFAPIVYKYGTDSQRARHLRPLFTEEERWCLLLSEPNAGSDLGGLTTRAVRDGDRWVLNGQKVWTSIAHRARWGFALVRHDPDAPKHRGLTTFIVDMHQPGVDVRPLRQMTGDAEFNEVFLTDVVVPDSDRVGEIGQGWQLMMEALANERFIIGHEITMGDAGPMAEALEVWRRSGSDDPRMRDRLARLWSESAVIRWYSEQAIERHRAGTGGSESAVVKLAFTQFIQRAYEFIVDVMGADGILYENDYEFRLFDELALDGHDPRRNFLAARSRTIGGGTTEILKTSIGERALGLPREPR